MALELLLWPQNEIGETPKFLPLHQELLAENIQELQIKLMLQLKKIGTSWITSSTFFPSFFSDKQKKPVLFKKNDMTAD